jgi:lactoylglutathione lyase
MKHLSHVMLRVRDLDRSIEFYTDTLGLTLVKRKEYPGGQFSIAFLACLESAPQSAMIELTYNWDNRAYEHGNYFGHIAFVVDDIYSVCKKIENRGGEFSRKPGPMTASPEAKTLIAFIDDPDGHRIELIQRG